MNYNQLLDTSVHLYSIAINFQLFLKSYLYNSIKLYISITPQSYFALSKCVFFISVIQSVSGAEFLNILLVYYFYLFVLLLRLLPVQQELRFL